MRIIVGGSLAGAKLVFALSVVAWVRAPFVRCVSWHGCLLPWRTNPASTTHRTRAAPPQGVRVLRARNLIRQPVSTPAKVREEPLTKGFSRLSPLALRMLVRRSRHPSPP